MFSNSIVYVYRIQRENVASGKRSGSVQDYYSNIPLRVGGLYMHLRDLSGAWRVIELAEYYNAREVDHE